MCSPSLTTLHRLLSLYHCLLLLPFPQAQVVAVLIMLLIVATSVLFIMESLPEFRSPPGADRNIFFTLEAIAVVFFTLELLLRLISCPEVVAHESVPAHRSLRGCGHNPHIDTELCVHSCASSSSTP